MMLLLYEGLQQAETDNVQSQLSRSYARTSLALKLRLNMVEGLTRTQAERCQPLVAS